MKDILIRVRLYAKHLRAAVTALQFWGDHLHDDARHESDPTQAKRIREEAEECFAARTSLQNQYQGEPVNFGSQASAPHASASNAAIHEGNTKLLPWLMLTAVLAGVAVGISIMNEVDSSKSESRTIAELDKQNRFLQEYRIRVEDAEIAAEEVNPKFHPRRTE